MIELRTKVSEHLAGRYGVTYDPRSELTITVGASEAVDASLRAILDPGDEVIYHESADPAHRRRRGPGRDPRGAAVPGLGGGDRGRGHTAHEGHLPGLSQQPDRRGAGAR